MQEGEPLKPAYRMIRNQWGSGNPSDPTRFENFNGTVEAITIGPNSQWSSVKVQAPNYPDPILVSVERPWFGQLSSLQITADVITNTPVGDPPIGVIDLQLWEETPLLHFGARSPLRAVHSNIALTGARYIIDGRRTVRVFIQNGNVPQNITIRWLTYAPIENFINADVSAYIANQAKSFEFNAGKGETPVVGSVNGTHWNGAHGIEVVGALDNIEVLQIEAFDW